MNQRVILVFARAPVPGQAKTRLIPAIGEEGAAALQRRLLERTLEMTSRVTDCDVQLWCAPDTEHNAFQQMEKHYSCHLHQQVGNDLGDRMANAMEQALGHYRAALVIGTDCPELGSEDIVRGFSLMGAGMDAVIGPAVDGGYYLLGLNRFEAALFCDIEWGSERVLAQTLEQIRQSGMHCGKLPLKHDLDRPDDLKLFPELNEG